MKLLSGLAVVAYAQSGDGSAETGVEAASTATESAPAFRQRAIPSGGNNDYEYYYEQSALGRRKKKKKKKIIFNIPQARPPVPTTTRAPVTTRAPLPQISDDYSQLFGANGSFGSKVSDSYNDYSGGSAGIAGNGSDRWSGFGGSDYAYDYADGFGEITVGSSFGGKGQLELGGNWSGQSGVNPIVDDTVGGVPLADIASGSHVKDSNNNNELIWDNDDINKYWEFMHRQWGHQQENRLGEQFAYDPKDWSELELPSRWYHVAPERVINNLNRGYLNYQFPSADGLGELEDASKNVRNHFKFPIDRQAFLQAGRHGHPWGIIPTKEWDMAVEAENDEGGDGDADDGQSGRNKFGWYAQPWLWDAENVPGISDYKLWNGIKKGQIPTIGQTVSDQNTQNAITHTFGFIDWADNDNDSWADNAETGAIGGAGIRSQDVSPARAPWYGRRFDASWELGDSPAHFVYDGVDMSFVGKTPFDSTFSHEAPTINYLLRTTQDNNDNDDSGWQRYYSGYRWFPGIETFPGNQDKITDKTPRTDNPWYNPTAAAANKQLWAQHTPNMHGNNGGKAATGYNQVHDPAKLKCHHCIEQAHLEWDNTYHTFKLVSAHSIGSKHFVAKDDLTATTFGIGSDNGDGAIDSGSADMKIVQESGVDLWKQCFDTLKQRSCEYSSGVCFVEERRVWGYVTQVQAGCQQAQACYMQKYQNFVVEAGRQCWPGDAFGETRTLARRPDDMRADQWIYNIIKGGLMLAAKPEPSDWANGTAGANGSVNQQQLRKFPSHYFTELENNELYELSSLVTERATNPDNYREANNWVDKFHTDFRGDIDATVGDHYQARATLTDGNYGVGRPGYESAFKTRLHYPEFLDIGNHNNYIYRGGYDNMGGTNGGLANTGAAYVPADITHSNQVYGMKISDALTDSLDAANKGQSSAAGEVVSDDSQTAVATPGAQNDLDFNGIGGADGTIFAERSQFYQNENAKFASAFPIDDQWRNPDTHNYLTGGGTSPLDTDIYRRTYMGPRANGETMTRRWDSLDSTLSRTLADAENYTESSRFQPIEYKNGLVEASKCHQCCNTDHNCNWNWQPTTKLDWNFAYVWRYADISKASNNPTTEMGVGANGRAWGDKVPTLSQATSDFTFNFNPYMANHAIVRGNIDANAAPPGTEHVGSDDDSIYAITAAGTEWHLTPPSK